MEVAGKIHGAKVVGDATGDLKERGDEFAGGEGG